VEIIHVKTFFTFFYFGHVFTFLTFCFYFPNVFLFLKTLAKFRAARRLTRSNFKVTATKLNGIFRVALKDISWASSVELNTLRRGNVFYYVYKRFFKFLSRFLTFLFLFERFYIYGGNGHTQEEYAMNREERECQKFVQFTKIARQRQQISHLKTAVAAQTCRIVMRMR